MQMVTPPQFNYVQSATGDEVTGSQWTMANWMPLCMRALIVGMILTREGKP
jgi:hypothetical protein